MAEVAINANTVVHQWKIGRPSRVLSLMANLAFRLAVKATKIREELCHRRASK